jgi:hypothetical protein
LLGVWLQHGPRSVSTAEMPTQVSSWKKVLSDTQLNSIVILNINTNILYRNKEIYFLILDILYFPHNSRFCDRYY